MLNLIALVFLIIWLIAGNEYYKSLDTRTSKLHRVFEGILVGCGIAFISMLLLAAFVGCVYLLFS